MAETTAEMPELKHIPLGSGYLFCKEFEGDVTDVNALIEEIEAPENELGCVSGGASLEYKITSKSISDDLGRVSRTIITEDEATLKGGVCTWNGNTLKKLCSTARVTEDTEHKLRIVKLGGVQNSDGKRYAVMFRQKDAGYPSAYVIVVGTNQKGINLTFDKEKETVLDPEFLAEPCDDEGTKVIYAERLE